MKRKLLESATVQQQAAYSTKEQFANSPDFKRNMALGLLSEAIVSIEFGGWESRVLVRRQNREAVPMWGRTL
jgi:hypothetical protein